MNFWGTQKIWSVYIWKIWKHFSFVAPIFLLLVFAFYLPVSDPAYALEKIEVTTVDSNATGYGTFQSHNQKVVANQYGIFMTHLHSRNEAYDQNTWRLSRSTDGGKTFTTLYESTNGTSAPVIETDSSGTIYIAHPDWGAGYQLSNAYLYRFTPNNFKTPQFGTTIPNGAGGKYAMILDEKKQQIYYFVYSFSGGFRFYIINYSNGQLKKNYTLTTPGSSATSHYPYLYLDNNGILYAAWTTTPNSQVYLYWDIHFMLSKNGGDSWQKPNNTPLSLPVVADQTGPADRITLDDEFNVHTWLWNLVVKNGKAHFAYKAQFPSPNARMHYVRYDLKTAKKDLDTYPTSLLWKGETISIGSLDGFCATKVKVPDYPIYCVSAARSSDPSNKGTHLGALVSYDNGTTWHDYAISDFNDQGLYSIGGSREITDDGYLIGSYTDTRNGAVVRFFRIKTVASPPNQTPTITPTKTPTPAGKQGDFNKDGKVDIFDYNILLSNFGKTNAAYNLTGNNLIDVFDYNMFVSLFGK
jgi:hypothetical protein